MRGAGVLGLMLIGGLAALASASDAVGHVAAPAACWPGRGTVVAADPQVAVFEKPTNGGTAVFGCAYGQSHVYSLGLTAAFYSSGGGGVKDVTVAGKFVALTEIFVATEPEPAPNKLVSWVVVRDLRTGRVWHKVPTGSTSFPGDVGIGAATDVVVKPDGAAAWSVQNGAAQCGGPEVPCYEVHTVDKTGTRTVGSGAGIAPRSLAVAGSTLYWMQAGKAAAATLN